MTSLLTWLGTLTLVVESLALGSSTGLELAVLRSEMPAIQERGRGERRRFW